MTVFVLLGINSMDYKSEVIKKVPTTHKVVALTFDDGPYPDTTQALLKVLSERQAKATFFVLGSMVERYPDLAAKIISNGHELASHSYEHIYLNRLNNKELENEVKRAEKAFSLVGVKPVLLRPPGGGYNDRMVTQLKQLGYDTVLWSIDTRDWDGRNVGEIVGAVEKKAGPGDIILLHEGSCAKSTPAALAIIIEKLQSQGYKFITVSELLQYYEIR